MENQITAENVKKVNDRVRVVAEGANAPTHPEAISFSTNAGSW